MYGCRIEQHEGAPSVPLAAENPAPHEARGNAGREIVAPEFVDSPSLQTLCGCTYTRSEMVDWFFPVNSPSPRLRPHQIRSRRKSAVRVLSTAAAAPLESPHAANTPYRPVPKN